MLSAFIAAIGNSIEVLSTKVILKEKGVSPKNFLALTMVFIFFVSLVVYIFLGKINFADFNLKYALIFGAMIAVAFTFNYLYYFAIYKEEVCDVEPIIMLEPLITVSMAAVIFPSERNIPILLLTIFASIVLIASRIEKKHLKYNKYLAAMVVAVILMSTEYQLVKVLLDFLSPVALYCFRVGIVSTLILIFLRPNFKSVKTEQTLQMFFLSIVIVVELISRFYAIEKIGIVNSSLIFLLGPVLILLSSKFILKEKVTIKKALADLVIIGCVAASTFLG